MFARGNHESCTRAGQGWWRFLDPRPCARAATATTPANDAHGDYSDPYAVPLGDGAQLIVFDTANTSYKGLPRPTRAWRQCGEDYRKIDALAREAPYNIGVDHHPLFALRRHPRQGRRGDAVRRRQGPASMPSARSIRLTCRAASRRASGHVHLWEQASFASEHPTQFVSGFSGTAEDIVPLPAMPPAGKTPAPGAVVGHMSSWIDGFGFMTMERTGPRRGLVKVWDPDGRSATAARLPAGSRAAPWRKCGKRRTELALKPDSLTLPKIHELVSWG